MEAFRAEVLTEMEQYPVNEENQSYMEECREFLATTELEQTSSTSSQLG